MRKGFGLGYTYAMNINFVDGDESGRAVRVDKEPDECPLCRQGIKPINRGFGQTVRYTGCDEVECVFECPRGKCQRLFIARYYGDALNPGFYRLGQCVPYKLPQVQFSETMRTVSNDFCEIYDQAFKAERHGLVLVAGPGYRKALEFLIKDYLCRLHPTEKEKIEKMQLADCISKYVNDARIQATASRAAWLGNDETHYVRKWDDKDLPDLKRLIELTMHWIEMEELTKAAVKEMPAGKK